MRLSSGRACIIRDIRPSVRVQFDFDRLVDELAARVAAAVAERTASSKHFYAFEQRIRVCTSRGFVTVAEHYARVKRWNGALDLGAVSRRVCGGKNDERWRIYTRKVGVRHRRGETAHLEGRRHRRGVGVHTEDTNVHDLAVDLRRSLEEQSRAGRERCLAQLRGARVHRVTLRRLTCITVIFAFAGCGGEENGKSSEPPSGGSLRVANHGHFAIAMRVGRVASYGDLLVVNDGASPVTLEEVSWDRASSAGISVLGQLVAGPEREETIGFDFGFPMKEIRNVGEPLEGYVVQPSGSEDAVQVVIGVKTDLPGRHQLRNMRLHYRTGSERRTLAAPGSLTLCAPASVECHAPGR